MSQQINTAFVNQFSANIQMLSQQMGSRLRDTVDVETITGEKAFFEQVGSAAAVERTSRHADTPMMETPHSRRMVTMRDFEYADLIDQQDRLKLLIDPTSSYSKAAAASIGRKMDDVIIAAMGGNAFTGQSGGTTVALPSTQKIAHGSTGLTIAKLLQSKKMLDSKDVDPSIKRYFVCSPEQMEDLLNTTQITSIDFNTVRALVNGQISEFLGFTFVQSNRLTADGSNRLCYAYAEDGIKMAMGAEPKARIEERADKSYATQVYYCASFSAVRMEEVKVVEVACAE